MGIRHRQTSTTVLVVGALVALGGCGSGSDSGGAGATASGGVQLVNSGTLTVCTHLSYKPFEFKEGSKVVGFDVDLMDLAAKKLGLEHEVVDIEFATITSGAVFAAKKCDAGYGCDDDQRQAQEGSPSSPTPTSAPPRPSSPRRTSGHQRPRRASTARSSVSRPTRPDRSSPRRTRPPTATSPSSSMTCRPSSRLLQSGRVDAADQRQRPVCSTSPRATRDFAVVKEFDTGEQYGFVGQKDNANATKLMGVFNDALSAAIKDGTYAKIYKTWFGAEPAVLPSAS